MRTKATSLRVTVGEVALMVSEAHEAMERLGMSSSAKTPARKP